MDRRPPRSTRTYPHFPYPTLFRSLSRIGALPGEAHSLSDKEISRVLEGRDGTLWIATFNAGLLRIDRNGRVLETFRHDPGNPRSEEHTSELQSLMRISYAVFCLKKKK